VIRLRPRIGVFRALSVLVLVGGLVGGLLISDRKSQQRTTANTLAAQAADAPAVTPSTGADDQRDAQNKADDAATSAAEQVKSADDAARSSGPASRSTPRGPATGGTAPPAPPDCEVYSGNRKTGCTLALAAGFSLQDVGCLVSLWNRESGWNEKARNASSGAYGIAQAVPPTKMATVGADWQTNPVTQIKWGLGYIKGRYKTPCGAWSHSQAKGWY
jgi:hypothetical protein